ncbi:SET domain-containing protein [Maricaulis sp.]|uniref:SET domain-containing protein n=1 Tax=Maricaulis sp. TaxID=1486257 RepID=UPI0025B9F3C2|nr:SET domain-containing protein [Maricaulis sp.]
MLLVDTYLAPSPLEGLGVFASEFIPAGTLIWVLDPAVDLILTESQLTERPPVYRQYMQRYAYFDRGLNGYLLDGDHARFLNHSDEPNLDFRADGNGEARRDIHSGEEILCDYSQFMEDVVLLPTVLRHNGAAPSA